MHNLTHMIEEIRRKAEEAASQNEQQAVKQYDERLADADKRLEWYLRS